MISGAVLSDTARETTSISTFGPRCGKFKVGSGRHMQIRWNTVIAISNNDRIVDMSDRKYQYTFTLSSNNQERSHGPKKNIPIQPQGKNGKLLTSYSLSLPHDLIRRRRFPGRPLTNLSAIAERTPLTTSIGSDGSKYLQKVSSLWKGNLPKTSIKTGCLWPESWESRVNNQKKLEHQTSHLSNK